MKTFYSRQALRRRRRLEALDGAAGDDAPPPRRRGLFGLKTILIGAGAIVLFAWLAPMIVGYTPLRNQVLAWAAPSMDGSLSAGGASLGWFSPVVLTDVELRDSTGGVLLKAPVLKLDRTLLSLMTSSSNLGVIHLDKPQLQLRCDEKSSNLEEFLSPWLDSPESSLNAPEISLDVTAGAIAIEDEGGGGQWQIQNLNLNCKLGKNWTSPLVVKAKGQVDEPGGEGDFDLDLTVVRKKEGDLIHTSGKVNVDAGRMPLALAQPLLRRVADETEISGLASGKLIYAWGDEAQTRPGHEGIEIKSDLIAENFELSTPALRSDALRLARVQLPCRLTLDDDEMHVEELKVDCDVGQVTLDGALVVALTNGFTEGFLDALMNQDYGLVGKIDLAALSTRLPDTLRIREGTQITSGELAVEISRRTQRNVSTWKGKLRTTNLTATNKGRPVMWKQPIQIDLSARQTPEGPVVDMLDCNAVFMDLEASGNKEFFSVSVEYNLEKLAAELGQFVDMTDLKLAGDGWSYVRWSQTQVGKFEAEYQSQIRDFEFLIPGGRPWRERELTIVATMTGEAEQVSIRRVQQLQARMEARRDRLDVKLLKPVDSFSSHASWPLALEINGNVAKWISRLEAILGEWDGVQLDGDGKATANVTLAHGAVRFADGHALLKDFRIFGADWSVQEPTLRVDWAGQWSGTTRRADIDRLDIQCPALMFTTTEARISWPEQAAPKFTGTLAFSGDMAKLQKWLPGADDPKAPDFRGQAQGNLKVSQTGQAVWIQWDTTIDNPQIVTASGGRWQQRRVYVAGDGRYEPSKNALQMDSLELDVASREGSTFKLEASGQIKDPTDKCQIDIEGHYDYDVQRLLELSRPWVGEGVHVNAERHSQPFVLRGPWSSLLLATERPTDRNARPPIAGLLAAAQVDWTGADVYGFRLGSGEVVARLQDGVLKVNPIDVTVSDGRLTATPKLDFMANPAVATLNPGPILTRVRISPEMCHNGLKYIAPLLAGVTEAQGQFSLDVNGCRIPVADPMTGEIAGRMMIHTVDVGPGPLMYVVVGAVDLIRTAQGKTPQAVNLRVAQLKRESVVPYRMVNGKVYHQDLTLEFDGVTVSTYGAVGLDESLDIVAKVRIPTSSGRLPGRTSTSYTDFEIPIVGTIDHPRIDRERLPQTLLNVFTEENLLKLPGLREALEKGAGKATDKLNEGLNKLFDAIR